jgi:hypothetical protein
MSFVTIRIWLESAAPFAGLACGDGFGDQCSLVPLGMA